MWRVIQIGQQMARQAAQEATQRQERDAETQTPAQAAEPSRSPDQCDSTARQTPEPERAAPSAPEREGRRLGSIVGGILGGIAKPVENFIMALADLFAAPPPMTKEQTERAARTNDEKAEARADHAAQQEKAAAVDWLIFEQNRQRRYDDLMQGRLGRSIPREIERDEDDRGRE